MDDVMKLSIKYLLLLLLSLPVMSAPGQDQGFAVDSGALISVFINNKKLSTQEFNDKFSKRDSIGLDYYIAKPGQFDGTEDIVVDAYYVDAAGNRSVEPTTLRITAISTQVPETPIVKPIKNTYSSKYSQGFSVSSGALPKVYINGAEITGKNLFDWFDKDTDTDSDVYRAKPQLFEGDEDLIVVAYNVSNNGLQSKLSDPVKLPAIDTVSPESPNIIPIGVSAAKANRPVTTIADKTKAGQTEFVSIIDLNLQNQENIDDEIDGFIKHLLSESNNVENEDTPIDTDKSVEATSMLDKQSDSSIKEVIKDIKTQEPPISIASENHTEVQKNTTLIEPNLSSVDGNDVSFVIENDNDIQKFLDWYVEYAENSLCAFNSTIKIDVDNIQQCLFSAGFVNAQITELTSGLIIAPGERVSVKNMHFKHAFKEHIEPTESFQLDIENQVLNTSVHVNALRKLEKLGFINDASFSYLPIAQDTYDIDLYGDVKESSIGLGVSFTENNETIGMVKGRHFYDFFGLRSLDYQFGRDSNGRNKFSISTHLYYDVDHDIRTSIYSSPIKHPLFSLQQDGFNLSFTKDNLYLSDNVYSVKFSGAYISSEYELISQDFGQTVYEFKPYKYWLSEFSLNSSSIYHDNDFISASLSNVTFDDGTFENYQKVNLTYGSGYFELLGDFNFNFNFDLTVLTEDTSKIPLDNRLYLGGASSVRGVVANYIGASSEIDMAGGQRSANTQLEISRNVNILGVNLNLGVHYDVGVLDYSGSISNTKVNSYGVFAKTLLNKSTELYAYFSKSNVDSDGSAPVGLSIVKRF
jgi:hypothetical protein